MKKTPALIVSTLLVLASLNWLIVAKERILQTGQTVLCELAPRDPRSIMQGDYMFLRYSVAEAAANDIATFKRLDDDTALAGNEVRIRFRRRQQGFPQGMIRIGAESYFFQEGRADDFSKAKYGELKVAPSGECILVGLRTVELERL
jgi:uncharacterized membrane-anchored protein